MNFRAQRRLAVGCRLEHLAPSGDYRSSVPETDNQPEFFLRADRFALYESHKGQYRVIADWPLAQPSEAG